MAPLGTGGALTIHHVDGLHVPAQTVGILCKLAGTLQSEGKHHHNLGPQRRPERYCVLRRSLPPCGRCVPCNDTESVGG
jgi:hypothetical protein